MIIRSSSWRWFVAGGLLVVLTRAVAQGLAARAEQGPPNAGLAAHPAELARLLGVAAAVAVVATLALVLLYFRLRRRVLLRVVSAVRKLSAGETSAEVEIDGRDELAALSASFKALRQRLVSQVELIERQRRMLQSLVDHLQEGVIVARRDGRIALINPTAIRLLNLGPALARHGSLLDQPVETCIPYHPLQRLLSFAEPAVDRPAEETRLEIETGGGTVYLLARASEVVLAEPGPRRASAPLGRVVMLTDITELQRTIQMRADFVVNASHELRTPLSTIRAAVETLLAMDLPTEALAARAFLEKVNRHSIRIESLVADLLDLSRLETPAERFEPETIECSCWLQDLQTRFADRCESKQLHWQGANEPPEAGTICVNPHLLRLALDNLVDNAIKSTDPGGHVGVQLWVKPDAAVFEVSDDGCGIPEDEQQRVFERFYQVLRARSGPERGTGLGLSIVRHSVAAMRGTVRLESRLGQGTRVTITIPQTDRIVTLP